MRAHLFVPVLFAIASLGGVALAHGSAGGGASPVAAGREPIAREHVVRERVAREHVARPSSERVARPSSERVERLARSERVGRPASASAASARPEGSRTSGASQPSSRTSAGNTHCEPGSSGCGERSRSAPVRESHFNRAPAARAQSAAERRELEKLVQVLQAKMCSKAHCGEQ